MIYFSLSTPVRKLRSLNGTSTHSCTLHCLAPRGQIQASADLRPHFFFKQNFHNWKDESSAVCHKHIVVICVTAYKYNLFRIRSTARKFLHLIACEITSLRWNYRPTNSLNLEVNIYIYIYIYIYVYTAKLNSKTSLYVWLNKIKLNPRVLLAKFIYELLMLLVL